MFDHISFSALRLEASVSRLSKHLLVKTEQIKAFCLLKMKIAVEFLGFIGHCGLSKATFHVLGKWVENLQIRNVSRKVGCWFLSSQCKVSVNHVETSASCWDDTFSTDVCDKWNISEEWQGVIYSPFCYKLGFHNLDLILWPHSILLFLYFSCAHMFLYSLFLALHQSAVRVRLLSHSSSQMPADTFKPPTASFCCKEGERRWSEIKYD